MRFYPVLRCACWLALALPVGAAPVLERAEALVGQGLLLKAQENFSYEVKSANGRNLVFLLKQATLGQIPTLFPTNFGSVVLSQAPEGVLVRVTFTQPDTPYQFQPNEKEQSLLLQVTPKLAQVPAPATGGPPGVRPPAPPRASLSTGVTERITLKARNQEVRDTLGLLSRISRTSIVIDPSVQSRVTLNLENVPFEDALKSIVALGNVQFRKEGDVYVVSPKPPALPPGTPGAPDETGLKDAGDPRPRALDEDPGLRLVSVIANDTEISRVLKEMANQANVELVLSGQLNDPISVRLINRSFEDALNQLLAGTNFAYNRVGNVFRVGDATPGSPTSKSFTDVQVLRLTNSSAKVIFDLLPPALATLNQGIRIDEARNALVVSGPPAFQANIAALIRELDTPIDEVSFGVKIVELTETGSQAFRALASVQGTTALPTDNLANPAPLSLAGVLSSESASPILAFNDAARILNVVSGLVDTGQGKVLNDTKVTTISGQTASINVFQDLNIRLTNTLSTGATTIPTVQIQTFQAGTTVQITPTVQANGNVFTDLKIESSQPSFARNGTDNAPDVSRRQVSNKLILRDGDTVEIGGLIQTTNNESKTRLPILGYLPLIGDLFSSTTRSSSTNELLVFITAYVNRRSPRPELNQIGTSPLRLDKSDKITPRPNTAAPPPAEPNRPVAPPLRPPG